MLIFVGIDRTSESQKYPSDAVSTLTYLHLHPEEYGHEEGKRKPPPDPTPNH
jgi:hypothetical protein